MALAAWLSGEWVVSCAFSTMSGLRSLSCTHLQGFRHCLHEVGIRPRPAPPNVRYEFPEPHNPGVN